MGASHSKFWIAGGAVVSVIVLVAVILLSYKPALDEAAGYAEEREMAEIQNLKLSGEIKKLRDIEARLPEIRERIAALQVGIPVAPKLDEFEAYLSELILDNDALLVSMTGTEAKVAVPAATTPEVPATPGSTSTAAPEPGGESSGTPAPTPSPAPEGTPKAEGEAPVAERVPSKIPPIEGLHVFDWEITVAGSYEQVAKVLEALQTTSPRHFLVTGLKFDAVVRDTPATSGLPERKRGDVDYKIMGHTYVLVGPQQPEEAPAKDPSMPKSTDDPFALTTGG